MKIDVKIKDYGLEKFFSDAKKLNNWKVKVGIFSGSAQGDRIHDGGITNAQLAAIMEFGGGNNIPARPALRPTFDRERENLKKMSAKLILDVLFEGMAVEKALGVLGAYLTAEVKKYITTGPEIPPPNTDAVRARKLAKSNGKGEPRTWIDTGKLLNAFTWQVSKDK